MKSVKETMSRDEIKLQYVAIISEAYKKLDQLRKQIEDNGDIEDDDDEENHDLYNFILTSGANILKNISMATGVPVESIAENI